MFWGLIMEPGKKYSQIVEKDFHIAQAALDLDSAQDSPVQVLISIDGRNYLVCTLIKDKICQANLDLNFRAGVKVSFATNGPGHVHLTGYLIEDNEFMMEEDSDEEIEDEESADEQVTSKKRKAQQKNNQPTKKTKTAMMLDQLDEESYNEDEDSNVNLTDLMDESDDDSDEEEAEDDAEEGSDDDSDDESSEEEEEVQQKVSPKKQKQHESPKQNGVAKKTPKHEKMQKVDKTPKGGDKSPKVDKTPKGPKTPGQEKQKTPKNKSPGGDAGTPGRKTLEGGVVIEDLRVGEGKVAKFGRPVQVYYEGRLKSNNKVFDSATKGAGFKFRLGKQEVIKGWDVGLQGMKIGGKRRITCPPNMAYGAAGSPPVIPPNSSLVFEVELKQVH